jgi:hypothetical protein
MSRDFALGAPQLPYLRTSVLGMIARLEDIMPVYDICYLDQSGALTCKFIAVCGDDKSAKILAHAMQLSDSRRLEVWSGESLIYQRPQNLN